jgi:hypothetical protein
MSEQKLVSEACASKEHQGLLTTDVVSRAGVRVTVGAAKVDLEAVPLVGDQVGVSVRRLTLGELIMQGLVHRCAERRSVKDSQAQQASQRREQPRQ